MKRFTLIEAFFLAAILAIVATLVFGSKGCSNTLPKSNNRVSGEKIDTPWGVPGRFYSITVDKHDYLLWKSSDEGSGTMCHKADCKKCNGDVK